MPYPGEYPQPLSRVTNVMAPAISGYVTSRLRAVDPIRPSTSGEDTTMLLSFENVGGTWVSVKLQQTRDRSVSGTRVDVISGVTLVPGGKSTKTTQNAYMEFLELATSDGGPSQVRLQITSNRRFEHLGFDKDADATFYPKQLWQAKPTPTASSV